jgi:hypothetical protein
MKQFWFILGGVVLALAAACFFVGWVELAMAPDTHGVIFTKSHGFENGIIRPEGFTWRWERLIPGAFTLYRFPVKTASADLSVKGSLPSGDVYASLSPEKPDFSFEIQLSLLYRVKTDALPALAMTDQLRPDGLLEWYAMLAREMSAKAAASALALPGPEASPPPGTGDTPAVIDIASISKAVSNALRDAFPQLEFVSIASNVVKVPDLVLYDRLRAAYFRMISAREEALVAGAAHLAVQEADQKASDQRQEHVLSLLEKYGDLLDKHPALIKLLFLASSKGFSPQDLENLDILGKLEDLQ